MLQEAIEKRLADLESQVKTLRVLLDIEEIKTVQRAYGYYLEHWMAEEVIDCFADGPDTLLSLYEGTWTGKEGIRRYFMANDNPSPDFLHQVMQVSPIVDVESDGKTGHGRWYSWGCVAAPNAGGMRQFFMGGIYEVVYLKQDAKWKIWKLKYSLHIAADPTRGWVSPERLAKSQPAERQPQEDPRKPDIPPGGMDTRYPSGYIFPFHFTHPVTGRATSEARRNAALKYIPNMFSSEKRE
jgi:hypothetical protein